MLLWSSSEFHFIWIFLPLAPTINALIGAPDHGFHGVVSAPDHGFHGVVSVESGVGGYDNIREGAEDAHLIVPDDIALAVVVVETVLVFEDIESSTADFAGLQGVDQSAGVNERAARGIDDDNSFVAGA